MQGIGGFGQRLHCGGTSRGNFADFILFEKRRLYNIRNSGRENGHLCRRILRERKEIFFFYLTNKTGSSSLPAFIKFQIISYLLIKSTPKSLTFVPVGPVITRPSHSLRALYASLSKRTLSTSMPFSVRVERVSEST